MGSAAKKRGLAPSTDPGFRLLQDIRFHQKAFEQICSEQFWRELHPELHISKKPFLQDMEQYSLPQKEIEKLREKLLCDGYFSLASVLPVELLEPFRIAVENISRAGFCSAFACVYDEFYQFYQRLEGILEALIDAPILMVPRDFWTFCVHEGETGAGAGPHRDSLGPDPKLLKEGIPSLINVWLPISDANLMNSCMYVLPASRDPYYLDPPEDHGLGERIDLQSIRPIPAAAGSIQAWSSHLLHWGSRSSEETPGPRVSLACYFQDSRVKAFAEPAFPMSPEIEIPFEQRLSWISTTIRNPQVFQYP